MAKHTQRRKFHTTIVMGAANYGMFVTEEVKEGTKVPVLALDFNDLSARGEWTPGHKSMTARTLCAMHGIRAKPQPKVLMVLDDVETADQQTPEHRSKVRSAVEAFEAHANG